MCDFLPLGQCSKPGQKPADLEPQTDWDTAPLTGLWSEAQGDLQQDPEQGWRRTARTSQWPGKHHPGAAVLGRMEKR